MVTPLPLGKILARGGSDIYHKTVVAKELLELRPTVTYEVTNWSPAGLECQFPGRDGILRDGWMMWQHFRDVHQLDIHSQGSKREEVPMVQEMRDVGKPEIPLPPLHKGLSGGGQAEAAGGNGSANTGPLTAVLCSRGCVAMSGGVQIPEAPACAG
jgi:hypothetical protein